MIKIHIFFLKKVNYSAETLGIIYHLNFKMCGHNSVVLLCYFFLGF